MTLFRRLLIGLVVAVLIPVAIVVYGWFAAGPSIKAATFIVPERSSVSAVAAELDKAGLITSRRRFKAGARMFGSGQPVQAGEFEIPARASNSAILDLLQHGRPVQRLLTVTEGMPSIIVQEKLAAIPYLTGTAPVPAEGSLLPDSYGYERSEPRS